MIAEAPFARYLAATVPPNASGNTSLRTYLRADSDYSVYELHDTCDANERRPVSIVPNNDCDGSSFTAA